MANNYGQIVKVLLASPVRTTNKEAGWDRRDFWLAQAVVDLVEALAVEKYYVQDYDKYHPIDWFQLSQWERDSWIKSILELRCISPADFAELKRRVGK